MTFLKLETSARFNRKLIKAGPAAAWLWVAGNCHCQDSLTDGFIADEALDFLGVKNARRYVAALEAVGLWDRVDGGWQVHDYLAHNRSAEEVREIQEKRRLNGKSGGRPKKPSENHNGLACETESVSDSVSGSVSGSGSELVRPSETKSAAAEKVAGRARRTLGAGVMGGMLPREHMAHAWCGNYRVCVPEFIHAELLARIGGDPLTRDARLREFYATTEAGLGPTATIAAAAPKFWRDAFEAAFGDASTPKRRGPAEPQWVIDARARQGGAA